MRIRSTLFSGPSLNRKDAEVPFFLYSKRQLRESSFTLRFWEGVLCLIRGSLVVNDKYSLCLEISFFDWFGK